MKRIHRPLTSLAALLLCAHAYSAPVFFSNRSSFMSGMAVTITDDYSSYGTSAGNSVNLSDGAMSAVFGETRYESRSFANLNLVGDVYTYGDGTNYCAGCNGNFLLNFETTSLSVSGGVYGVGLDIVLHTSRRSSDPLPGQISLPGTVLVEFADGSTESVVIPEDIGYFGPQIYFLGLVDARGIRSISVGTESLQQRHSWVIDNLTIAQGREIPEPSSASLFAIALLAASLTVGTSSRRLRTRP